MSTATLKRETRKAETRRALVEAAAELFAAQGIEATTIDDVAGYVGLTKGAVYAHFPNKAALVEEALETASTVVEIDPLVDPDFKLDEFMTQLGRGAAELLPSLTRRNLLLYIEYLLYVLRDPDRQRARVREQRKARVRAGSDIEKALRANNREVPLPGPELQGLIQAAGIGLALELVMDPGSISPEGVERFFAALGHGFTDGKAVNALLSTRPSR